MNKKRWLIAGLSLAMAASLGIGIAACGAMEVDSGDSSDTPAQHEHVYDAWDHDDTQHWKYCDDHGTDKSNIDESTKAAHDFTNGDCVCGAKKPSSGEPGGQEHTHDYSKWQYDETQHWKVCPDDDAMWAEGKVDHDFTNGDCVCGMAKPDEGGDDDTPDTDLDTREFWVTGSGAGDLKNSSWEELKDAFKLTREPKKDAEGFTLYTIQFQLYAGGDNFKIRQDERNTAGGLVWTDGTYFGLNEIRDNDGTFVDAGNFNIGVAKGKDGIYKFTVHTKPAPAPWADNYVSWELVKAVEPLAQTEDIYIVGPLKQYPTNAWPSAVKNGVDKDCIHLEFDGDKTWSTTVRLQTVDAWKLYNKVNGKYIPDPGDNLQVTKNGDWKISWTVGSNVVQMQSVTHEHYYNVDGHDTEQHYKQCWLDSEIDAESREDHIYDNDQDATCNTCGYERHVHKYTEWGKNESEHWMQCPDDGTPDESTRENHTFDQPDGTCKCGQEQGATCKHDGKINFSYTADNAPAIQAEGGTLHGTCGTCGEEVDVTYDVGVTKFSKFTATAKAAPTVLEVGKKYYGESGANTRTAIGSGFGLKVPDGAGTLVLKFYIVAEGSTDTKVPANVNGIAISDQDYLTDGLQIQTTNPEGQDGAPYFFIYMNRYYTEEAQTQWQSRITSDCISPAGTDTGSKASGCLPMSSVSVSFTAEDTARYFYCALGTRTGTKILIDVDFVPAAAAASINAPAEVAMLPGKNN